MKIVIKNNEKYFNILGAELIRIRN